MKNKKLLILVLMSVMATSAIFAQNTTAKTYKIGDIGPGGGIVFYIEGTRTYEVSVYLGSDTWSKAKRIAKNYKGGGYNDWHLPTKEELNLVYENLVKTGKIQASDYYWSSSQYPNSGNACYQSFSDGDQYHNSYKSNTYSVRAVRAF